VNSSIKFLQYAARRKILAFCTAIVKCDDIFILYSFNSSTRINIKPIEKKFCTCRLALIMLSFFYEKGTSSLLVQNDN
jgi:hypothetical protein